MMIWYGPTMLFESNSWYTCLQFDMIASDIANSIYQTIKQQPVPLIEQLLRQTIIYEDLRGRV